MVVGPTRTARTSGAAIPRMIGAGIGTKMRIRSLSTKPPARSTLYSVFAGLDTWNEVPDGEVGAVVQEWHFNHIHGLAHHPDPEKPGNAVWFALIEIEGKEPIVSRVYTSGIVRIGAIRRELTLSEIANHLGWEREPEGLLSAWEGEETEWY